MFLLVKQDYPTATYTNIALTGVVGYQIICQITCILSLNIERQSRARYKMNCVYLTDPSVIEDLKQVWCSLALGMSFPSILQKTHEMV